MEKKLKLLLILLFPAGLLLRYIFNLYPEATEKIYSRCFYTVFGQTISSITGFLPFSIAELIILTVILLILYKIISIVIHIVQSRYEGLKLLKNSLVKLMIIISILYFSFLILWGFNYQRLPFSTAAGLNVRPASIKELYDVCEDIIYRINGLRSSVTEDSKGNMYIPGGFSSVASRAYIGYSKAYSLYPVLGGSYGRPKAVILSSAMSYAGISGVFFPFTGEANVNILQTNSMLPCTACHEMAHQRGFAREDEANYISYIVCSLHPDTDFQYSGLLLALINSMNALYSHNPALYKELSVKYSPGVKRDLIQNDLFWQKYEGPVQKVSDKINDTYLKSNLQQDGVYSYGRMVDLLIAEYRKKNQ